MKLKKRIASALLAGVMTAALAVPAFATTTNVEKDAYSMAIAGSVEAPTLKMAVPSTAPTVTLNPYKLTVSGKTDEVVFTTSHILNLTQANVSVSVVAKATPTGMTLATAPLKESDKTKSAFLYLDTDVATVDTDGTTIKKAPVWGDFGTTDAPTKPNDLQAVLSATGASPKTPIVLKASADGDKADASSGAFAFTIGGSANGNSTEAWTTKDKVAVNLAFSFALVSSDATVSTQVNDGQ